jgi:hypothetical protein
MHAAQYGSSSLFQASTEGHIEVVKYLCELGGEKLLIMALLHLHICCSKQMAADCNTLTTFVQMAHRNKYDASLTAMCVHSMAGLAS